MFHDRIHAAKMLSEKLDYLKKTDCVILATPVIPYVTAEIIKRFGVQIISIETPKEFSSVGQFYRKFDQIPDSVVVGILHKFSAQSKPDI